MQANMNAARSRRISMKAVPEGNVRTGSKCAAVPKLEEKRPPAVSYVERRERKPIEPESLCHGARCKHGRRTAACEPVIVYIQASATNAAQSVSEASDSAADKVVQWCRLGRLRRCTYHGENSTGKAFRAAQYRTWQLLSACLPIS
jgi:hypothetical protein